MNLQKLAIGSVAGGVVYFLLGYLCYGVLLKDFFDSNTNPNFVADMEKMTWWALILGNLFSGALLAYIFGKANVSTAGGGASTGFVVGLLVALSFDLIMYGVLHSTTIKAVAADVAVSAVMSAIAGAVVGWVLGMGKKASVA